ncbi:3-methyladenine DNA glycosylase [Helicobacter pametensis]|uniref:3-methyladenine DNA glycosylase n=1 Tax=Helicobacter pametensis TaxID=95149 RepID=UPI0004800A64|nr:3-methyladenine DNA glycosylase [Helicobacter pametensis]
MRDSYQLFSYLHSLHLLDHSPSWWWPNHGDFEVVISAILTQNTRWENVQKSLQNLQNSKIFTPHQNEKNLQNLAQCTPEFLASLIYPSGFANQKAKRLILLAQNILHTYDSYAMFQNNADSQWLLDQKGIGRETRDAILNYACLQSVMVVDQYTYKLLCLYGYEIQEYDEIQEWITRGVIESLDKIQSLYSWNISLAQIYARFHGKIVEFAKKGFKA